MNQQRYSIIIPVKPVTIGKSRLRASGAAGDDLVAAIALDTIAAVRAAGFPVLVVTDDPQVTAEAGTLGAQVTPDAPAAGLNAAIRYGEALVGTSVPRAALTADLPALRPAELRDALSGVTARSFLADHTGTGTTTLAAPAGVPLDPFFGPGSAAAHAASGARPLDGAWPTLRLDVDTRDDLDAARTLGLGPRTGAARVGGMQGTVATYDPQRRDGSVLLDDGTELTFDGDAFAASGLRLLRFGQRLALDTDDTGRITRLRIPTLP